MRTLAADISWVVTDREVIVTMARTMNTRPKRSLSNLEEIKLSLHELDDKKPFVGLMAFTWNMEAFMCYDDEQELFEHMEPSYDDMYDTWNDADEMISLLRRRCYKNKPAGETCLADICHECGLCHDCEGGAAYVKCNKFANEVLDDMDPYPYIDDDDTREYDRFCRGMSSYDTYDWPM